MFDFVIQTMGKSEKIVVSMGTSTCNTKAPLFKDLVSTLKQDLLALLSA